MKTFRSIQSTVQPPKRLGFNQWALYIKKQAHKASRKMVKQYKKVVMKWEK